jgi:protein phosphatase
MTKKEEETTAELNAGEIVRGWDALTGRRPRKQAQIAWGGRSDIGRARENNEDKFDFYLPDDPMTLAVKGRLWAVADGMGGHNAGQIASEAALKAVIRSYFRDPGDAVADGLRAALADANDLIHRASRQIADNSGMGTTATVALVREDRLFIGQIGDSRAYLLRNGKLRQITADHSWVEEQVRRGGLSRAEAEASPYRNMITRSVGNEPTVEADIYEEVLREGDVVLLCSDGLTGYLDGPALAERLDGGNPSATTLALIDAANDAGGRDNITAIILAVRAVRDLPEPGGEDDTADAAVA